MSTRRRRTRPDRIDLAKDLILFGVGLVLIFRQGWVVPKADFNWVIFAVGVGLTQAPGGMAVIALLRGTESSSSSEASDVALSPSRGSSLASEDDVG